MFLAESFRHFTVFKFSFYAIFCSCNSSSSFQLSMPFNVFFFILYYFKVDLYSLSKCLVYHLCTPRTLLISNWNVAELLLLQFSMKMPCPLSLPSSIFFAHGSSTCMLSFALSHRYLVFKGMSCVGVKTTSAHPSPVQYQQFCC